MTTISCAASTATTAGAPQAEELLHQAVAVWQTRFWDDDAGLAVEEWDRAWRRLDGYRGVNANMHGVEASLAAADALQPVDPEAAWDLRAQALRTTERVVHGWARERDWRLPEHFTAEWEPVPEFNRDRPADGHPGFPYTLDWSDRPVVGARMHWVLCEAVAAASVLAEVTGDERFRTAARQWREHGEQSFADPSTGSWHHELTPTGDAGTSVWAGQPDAYHLAQMLLLDGRPVRGSLAAALR